MHGWGCRPWRGEEYKGLLVETGGEGREAGALTLAGLLAKWAFTTATDPVKTLAYVRYLGFEGSAAPLFAISKPRRQERKSEQLQRSVLQVDAPFLVPSRLLSRPQVGKQL